MKLLIGFAAVCLVQQCARCFPELYHIIWFFTESVACAFDFEFGVASSSAWVLTAWTSWVGWTGNRRTPPGSSALWSGSSAAALGTTSLSGCSALLKSVLWASCNVRFCLFPSINFLKSIGFYFKVWWCLFRSPRWISWKLHLHFYSGWSVGFMSSAASFSFRSVRIDG